jgi:hypothetical protein
MVGLSGCPSVDCPNDDGPNDDGPNDDGAATGPDSVRGDVTLIEPGDDGARGTATDAPGRRGGEFGEFKPGVRSDPGEVVPGPVGMLVGGVPGVGVT